MLTVNLVYSLKLAQEYSESNYKILWEGKTHWPSSNRKRNSIEELFDGAKTMSEALDENIINLQKQIEELIAANTINI